MLGVFGESQCACVRWPDLVLRLSPCFRRCSSSRRLSRLHRAKVRPRDSSRHFDGLGVGFSGPHGMLLTRNPSDNSLAVGRDQSCRRSTRGWRSSRRKANCSTPPAGRCMAPCPTNTVFKGFGGPCEQRNNGDAVVRYDQLADRWLIVMPIFTRSPRTSNEPPIPRSGEPAVRSRIGQEGQPGAAVPLFVPPPVDAGAVAPPPAAAVPRPAPDSGSYAMCYAISTGPDPMGPYWRYEFVRPLFPDYPRPAIWPDGYYVPSSTSDDLHPEACLRRGSSADAQRRERHRAVHRHR